MTKWPGWYRERVLDKYSDLSDDQRAIAKKILRLLEEHVANGVAKDKNHFHGTPLPSGFVDKGDALLLEAAKLYESLDI